MLKPILQLFTKLSQTLGRRSVVVKNKLRQPSTARGLILAAALLSFALSVFLYFGGNEMEGIFVGLWVPSILALGAFVAPRREPSHMPPDTRGGEGR
jgi:hypothetical protein